MAPNSSWSCKSSTNAAVGTRQALLGGPEAIRARPRTHSFAIVLIKRGSMLKTSSGKVQRRATREAYLEGELQVAASWQIETADRLQRERSGLVVGLPEPASRTRCDRSPRAGASG